MRDALALVTLAAIAACTQPRSVRETVGVGNRPVDLAAGDLNGDGHLDLVSPVAGDRRISVQLQGADGWSASPPLPVPVEPHLVALADLDRDGKLDVFATAHDSGGVWVWLGDGTGRFSPAEGSPFTAFERERPHNHGLAVGDLDGDGDPDVVVTDQEARAAAVLLAEGRSLKVTPGSPIDLGGQPYPPALGDLDGDGKLDLAVPLVGGNALALLKGDGAGGFQHFPGSPRRTDLARPYGIALGDVDGDGKLDVVASHDDTDRITVLIGTEARTTSLGRRVGTRLALADMDRDGHLDLVAAGSGAAIVARGDGRGGFSPQRAEPVDDSWSAIAADFDGDGRPDLAAADMGANAIRIWR